MHLFFFGLMVVFFYVLYILLLKYMHRVLLLLKRNRKRTGHNNSKHIKQFIVAFIIFILSLVISVLMLVKGLALAIELKGGNNTNEDVTASQYTDAIDKIPFHDETINIERTIWERLFVEELLYDKYEQLSENDSDFINLRRKYRNVFCDVEELQYIAIDDLKNCVDLIYGSEILPVTDKTLETVVSEILPLKERFNTNILVFENEFYLRAVKCDANSSGECFYQAARAADDAFKVLFREKNLSSKKIMFYGSMAVAFYLASIKYSEGNIDLVLVYYRIAEIYLYLYKYVGFIKENTDYSKHCLLIAEMFLVLAKEEYSKKMDVKNIHKKLPFFSYYYADILFDFIIRYCNDEKDEEIVSKCYKFANDFLNSPYTVSYKKNRDGCRDILTNLKIKGYIKNKKIGE